MRPTRRPRRPFILQETRDGIDGAEILASAGGALRALRRGIRAGDDLVLGPGFSAVTYEPAPRIRLTDVERRLATPAVMRRATWGTPAQRQTKPLRRPLWTRGSAPVAAT